MNLTELLVEMRIEIQETAESVFLDTELTRGVQKCVSLMSRLLPKRLVLETTLVREIIGETLTISSDTGTLAYKPIKEGSLTITGKTLDTDYRVNYLTGVVTEIGALLPDTTYTAKYDLHPTMLDISTLLPEEDYIKVEKVEHPVGNDPPTYLPFDVFGEFLLVRGAGVALSEDEHLRIIYHKPWTAPTASTEATLTTSLTGSDNDLVFTARVAGTVGNATTITYTDPGVTHTLSVAVSGTDIVVTLGYAAGAINSTAAAIEALIEADSDAVALVSVADATANDGTGLVIAMAETALTGGSDTGVDGDYPEHLDQAIIIGGVGQTLMFKAEKYVQSAVTALSALTAPTLGTFSAPTPPTLPTAPTATSVPGTPPDFTAASTALTAVGTEITAAKAHHTSGAAVANTLNIGARVAEIYGAYAGSLIQASAVRVNEALATLRAEEGIVSYYASQVASYASEVNSYANEMSGTVGKYREEIASEGIDAAFNNTMIAKYVAQANEQEMKARNFLDIAGRYLASGQSKINEFLIMLGIKPELSTSRSSSEQRS